MKNLSRELDRTINIILSDDDLADNGLFRLCMKEKIDNFDLKEFTNHEDMLAYVKTFRPKVDLYIIDYDIPNGIDGNEAIWQLRHDLKMKEQIVLLTGFDCFSYIACRYENVDYVQKPFRFEKIVTTNELLLRHV